MKPIRYIEITKGEQWYLFRYRDGDETTLIKAGLDYAEDCTCNLDYVDMIQFVRTIRKVQAAQLK